MMLELRNIFKTYVQGKLEVPVLKNISLSVAEGEYVAIMGPSGSGKTTLMNIIGCLDNPTSGEYLLEGEDIAQNNDAKMSEVRLHSIGFVFQSFYLLSRQSALENVALPLLYAGVHRKERVEIARRALERVGLGDRTEFKPTQLSGGQCQRVAIARAIVNNPKILLADEPTGALDTKSGEQIMDIFHKLNDEGVTIVMITHEPEIAAHAQRTLHIRDGRLVDEHGHFLTPEEPEALEDALPEDVIPVKEFLAEPLDSRETSAALSAVEEPAEDPGAAGGPVSPPRSVEIDSVIFRAEPEDAVTTAVPTVPEPVSDPGSEEDMPGERELPIDEAPPPEPTAAPRQAVSAQEEASAVPEPAEWLPAVPDEPDAGLSSYEEDTASAPDYEVSESFLDAEISALLDGETAHWEEQPAEETFPEPAPDEAPFRIPESSLPVEPSPFPEETVLPEDPDGFDISEVSQAIDLEESAEAGETAGEPAAEEAPPEAEPEDSLLPQGHGEAAYAERESAEESDVPEQLFFDVWGGDTEAPELPPQEESLTENWDSADPSGAPPGEFPDEQTQFGEDFWDESTEYPEDVPDGGIPEEPSGSFDAPVSLDADLSLFGPPKETGGFQAPIKIELDGLGLHSSPEASADKGDET